VSVELLSAALDPLRTGLQADGADIEVIDLDSGVATIRLEITDEACEDDCILPKPALESLFLATLRRVDPLLARVNVIDPRIESADRP
jgi:hypothetical protein